ncbi:MAG: tetratricopeptide repeat protein [Planctomycetes bacterium]|nr:tetratricopeptide repeat protein [Planctomycetota bacterium]
MTTLLAAALLLTATWAAYSPALRAGFIWDDGVFLTTNPHIQSNTGPWHFWKLWGPDRPSDYFPLTSSMLWMEWHWLWGDSPTGYHSVNVALHTISALLLWAVLRKLGLPGVWAWLGAMLFALHPVNVESVAWITERKNTLSMPLLLASLWCWLRSEEADGQGAAARRWYTGALGLFVLSLLAKTAGVTLPLTLLTITAWRRGRMTRRDIRRAAPFFLASAVLGVITVWYQFHIASGGLQVRSDGALSRLAIAGRAVLFYLGNILWPMNLCAAYPQWPAAAVDTAAAWAPLAVLAAACITLAVLRRRKWARVTLTGIAVFVVMLLPVLGFINISYMYYTLVADRWQYVAIPVPLALLAAGAEMLARHGRTARTVIWCAAAAAVLWLGGLTWRYAHAYHDSETFWRTVLATNPDSWQANNNLGTELVRHQNFSEAIPYLQRAVHIDLLKSEPHHIHIDLLKSEPYYNLGVAYAAIGDRASALHWYTRTLRVSPQNSLALAAAGTLLMDMDRNIEALPYLEKAVAVAPDSARTQFNLGSVLSLMGQLNRAVECFHKALTLDPDYLLAHNNLGVALAQLGRIDEAAAQFREALRIDPHNRDAIENLTNAELAKIRHAVPTTKPTTP